MLYIICAQYILDNANNTPYLTNYFLVLLQICEIIIYAYHKHSVCFSIYWFATMQNLTQVWKSLKKSISNWSLHFESFQSLETFTAYELMESVVLLLTIFIRTLRIYTFCKHYSVMNKYRICQAPTNLIFVLYTIYR